MTTVVVMADPPRPGLALPGLADAEPLAADERVALAEAMLKDVLVSVAESGGELLLNYAADEHLPDRGDDDASSADRLEAIARAALDEAPRMEVQVGSDRIARIGNAVTHLLDREGVQSAAVVSPHAPLLERALIDTAAMRLRRSEVVIGPAQDGRIYYLGFTDPIDFSAVSERDPPLAAYAEVASNAGHSVDLLPTVPVVRSAQTLGWVGTYIQAARAIDRWIPRYTADWIASTGLTFRLDESGSLTIHRTK